MSPRLLLAASLLLTAGVPASAQVSWRHYRPTNTGILGDYVQAIHLDDQDRPWIAAYTHIWEEGGMSRMNADGTWEVLSSFDHPAITSPRFTDIVEDAGGVLWIGTHKGLLRYDPAAGASSLARYDKNNTPMPGDRISDVDLAPDGTVWLAIYNVSGTVQGGLVRYTPSTGSWQVWTTANGLTWGGGWSGWNAVSHVVVRPDADGSGAYTVWYGSPHNLGMGTYRNGVFQSLGNPQSPPSGRYPMSFLSADPLDDQGHLWFLSNEGLVRQAADGSELVVGYPAGLSSEVSRVVALSNGRAALGTFYADVFVWSSGNWSYLGNWGSVDHTYDLAEDSTGALWVGGIGGAAKYQGGVWQRHRLTNAGMIGFFVRAIDFAPDGRVFVNGNSSPGTGGFDVFDGVRWTNVNDKNYGLGPVWGLPSDDVQALCFRANGKLALAPGGPQGLLEWDGTSYTYLIPQFNQIEHVAEDSLGRLWAAHDQTFGITRVTGTQTVTYTSSNSQLFGGSIGSVEDDPAGAGYVWITTQFGVAHTDGSTWNLYPRELLGLTQNTTSELLTVAAPAPDGTLWIGSFNGLYHFDPQTSQYTRYHPGNSALPSTDVTRIHVAPDGSVWVATFDEVGPYPGGLTRFDGAAWTHYSTASSELPHNQIWALNSRPTAGGYEVWVGMPSEAVAVLDVVTAPVFCAGDGSGAACPCGNTGEAGHGCANSAAASGARLSAAGSASVSAASLVLSGAGLVPSQPGLYFQGANAVNGGAGLAFGDGLRCAGGDVRRIQVVTASAAGTSATTADVAARGGIVAGDVRRYQLWYRDPSSVCGTGFNLSNGVEITWTP